MIKSTTLILASILLFSGCAAVQDFGTAVRYNVQGEYYLQEKNYQQGLDTFGEVIEADPFSSEANYYYGRFLLAEKQAAKALPYLERAVGLDPQNSKYHFWHGVAFGENNQEDKERESYTQALLHDPQNAQALTYLGNNYFRAREYAQALKNYQWALAIDQNNPQALYNRANILRRLDRKPEEEQAWQQYLDTYPAGSFARRAADYMNTLGNHSYRNYQLGLRTVTLAEIQFTPFTAELDRQSLPSLDLIGTTVSNMDKGILNVIVYQLNNRELAKERAVSIRNYLTKKFPEFREIRQIRLSWFDVPEKRQVLDTTLLLNESVQIFLTDY
ncbi:MAG: tetratricopeptide repeat protein [Desulfocapsaceae bacterium]|nr:tetratricopeptide repeat protein [Desulfocapsaceae bacterium]